MDVSWNTLRATDVAPHAGGDRLASFQRAAFLRHHRAGHGLPFYDVYDIVVNSMLKGAVGFVAAILVFMMGIGLFFMQKIIPGVIAVVCAALIVKADGIVTSLGLLF